MYDHASLFEEADTEIKTIADATKIAFGIDYKPVKAKEDGNGSNGVGAVGVDDNGSSSGERSGGNDAKGGELLPEGDGKADGGRGNQGNSGEGTGRDVGSEGKTDNQGNPISEARFILLPVGLLDVTDIVRLPGLGLRRLLRAIAYDAIADAFVVAFYPPFFQKSFPFRRLKHFLCPVYPATP